jgi:hypothetical protein
MCTRKFALRALVASFAVALATAASAQAPSTQDLVGTWNITLTSPQGSHPTTVVIKDDAGQLVGEVTGMPTVGGMKVTTSDAGVRLTFAVDYQGQPVDVVMVGKLAGAELKGTVDYANGAATGDFAGTKAGAAAAAPAAGTSASGVGGVWDITGDGGGGYSFNLAQDGTAVSGVLKTPDGAEVPVKGTFEQNALNLTVHGDSMAGTIKGTLEGAGLKGSYDIGGNTGSWSATRKP